MTSSSSLSVLPSASMATIIGLFLLTGCQTTTPTTAATHSTSNGQEMVQNLMRVEENHHVMNIGDGKYAETYVLDSYIIPFQQPYYILVRKQDGKPFMKHAAEVVAKEYIKPRGCTEPLKRREDLDQQNSDGSAYVIGVAC